MLNECNMDPNDTVQKLLSQGSICFTCGFIWILLLVLCDTKYNCEYCICSCRVPKVFNTMAAFATCFRPILSLQMCYILNSEFPKPRWKPGMQGRGNRGGHRNYSSPHISNGASGSRKSLLVQETGINQGAENGPNLPMPQSQMNKEKIVARSSPRLVPDRGTQNTTILSATHSSVGIVKKQSEVGLTFEATKGLIDNLSKGLTVKASKCPTAGIESGSTPVPVMLTSNDMPASKTLSPSPGVGLSDSDPILMPSQDSRLPVGTIRREIGSQRSLADQIPATTHEIKSVTSGSEVGNSTLQRKAASSHVPFSTARPSSNYNNRLQQAIAPQKVSMTFSNWFKYGIETETNKQRSFSRGRLNGDN